ncbi:hypothetical protein MPER_08845, partial [Moniliophthora perniciosa FA553]
TGFLSSLTPPINTRPVSFYPAKHPAKPIELSELQGNTPLSILRGACYDQYEKSGEILQSSFRDQEPILARSNGFVNALTDAYNQHRALSIRPDDVWIAILAQFSFFVNTNAERIRAHFVEYEGQKELTVTTIGTRYTVDFGQLAKEMTEQIRANIKDQALCDWILPDFSTTTLNDTVVSSVVMMATLQKYFSYSKMLRCGIPKVTLEGEKADWEKLLARVDKLKEYGDETTKWFTLLHPVLSRLVAAFDAPDSQENIEFWQRVAHYKRGASGPRYVSGWMTAFCVFDEDGKWLAGNVNNKSHLVLDGTRYHSVDTKKIPLDTLRYRSSSTITGRL